MAGKAVSLFALAYLAVLPAASAISRGQAYLAPSHHRSEPERYDEQQVWRVHWHEANRETKDDILDAIALLDLDIWRSSPSTLDIRLRTCQIPTLHRFLPPTTPMSIVIPDLQSLIDLLTPSSTSGIDALDLSSLDTPYHDSYHSIEEIYAFGDRLVDEFPGIVEGFEVGKSYEGREIRGWRAHVEDNGSSGDIGWEVGGKKRRKIRGRISENDTLELVVQSGQHAREWIGPSTALYFMHALLVDANDHPSGEVAKLLRFFTFTIVPTINPDGFVHSQKHSRMWRKNRQNVGHQQCLGIDLNSNWGYKWRPGRATSPCSDSYPGTSAFEAFETRAMANYLANGTTWCPNCTSSAPVHEPGDDKGKPPKRRVRAFVDLHSYGQLFMFPFAHSCDDFPPDAEMLMEAGLGVAKAMRTRRGEGYQAGQACELTYRAPGDAIDFSYGVTDVQWSYSAELRDTGTHGFLLPPRLIRPTADELTAGMLYLAKFIYTVEIAG